MFARTTLRTLPVIRKAVQTRQMAGIPQFLQQNVWKKSMVNYLAYVMAGLIVVECTYGATTNFLWESINHGVSRLQPCLALL